MKSMHFCYDAFTGMSTTNDIAISHTYPAGNFLLKFNNRNTRTRCEICSKLTIKTLD